MGNRWKNIALWISLISLVPLVLQLFGIIVPPEKYQLAAQIINGVLTALAAAGIISNPRTVNLLYWDDKKNTDSEDSK